MYKPHLILIRIILFSIAVILSSNVFAAKPTDKIYATKEGLETEIIDRVSGDEALQVQIDAIGLTPVIPEIEEQDSDKKYVLVICPYRNEPQWVVDGHCPKTVFVTSESYSGNLGGLDGADEKCQELAVYEDIDGIFKAWLSDDTGSSPAQSRFTHSEGDYVLVDGTVVAKGWIDLTDGSLSVPIDVDEKGNRQGGSVWSATGVDGLLSTSRGLPVSGVNSACDNWSAVSVDDGGGGFTTSLGLVGFVDEVDSAWTGFGEVRSECDIVHRLYCFEQ